MSDTTSYPATMRGTEVGDWDELVRTGEWDMQRPFPLILRLAARAGSPRQAARSRLSP